MNSPTIALAADDQFALTLNGHTLLIPCTEAGVRVLRRILRGHKRTPAAKIGAPSNPVQHTVEQWLRADAGEKAQAVASITIEELGL